MSFKEPTAGDITIPSSLTADIFGKVNVRVLASTVEVQLTVMMAPQGKAAEGWQTGVALDGSLSMKGMYGRRVEGILPAATAQQFKKKGWIKTGERDGKAIDIMSRRAIEEGLNAGHLRPTPNLVEPFARNFLSYLADTIDADGGTSLIYWACGDGSQFEVVGDFSAAQCSTLSVRGPSEFGTDTMLLPAVKYFVERFQDAKRGMYVFLTDGRLADLEAVKTYTIALAREIANGVRNPLKCVLLGVGPDVVTSQLKELDDLETRTEVDIWDYKLAADMREILEIFSEVVDENLIVAPSGAIFDDRGSLVHRYSDGLPALITATLPAGSKWLELEVGNQRFRQSLIVSQPTN